MRHRERSAPHPLGSGVLRLYGFLPYLSTLAMGADGDRPGSGSEGLCTRTTCLVSIVSQFTQETQVLRGVRGGRADGSIGALSVTSYLDSPLVVSES